MDQFIISSVPGGLIVEVVAKATLILILAALLDIGLRRKSAALRHAIWAGSIVAMLVLPLASSLAPSVPVPVLRPSYSWTVSQHSPALPAPPFSSIWSRPEKLMDLAVGKVVRRDGVLIATREQSATAGSSASLPSASRGTQAEAATEGAAASAPLAAVRSAEVENSEADPSITEAEASLANAEASVVARSYAPPLALTLILVWATGTLACLLWLTAGVIGLKRIAQRAVRLDVDLHWKLLLDDESDLAGVRRPVRLLSSNAAAAPVTWGVRAPVILLPDDAREWSDARTRVVLKHELAHIARGDAFLQLMTGCACAMYWFHPCMWMSARRSTVLRERACDDRVLSGGISGIEYARHLVEVARSVSARGRSPLLSVAMAHTSELEERVEAILEELAPRAPRRGSVPFAKAGVLVLALGMAALQPVPQSLGWEPPHMSRVVQSDDPIVRAAMLSRGVFIGGAICDQRDLTNRSAAYLIAQSMCSRRMTGENWMPPRSSGFFIVLYAEAPPIQGLRRPQVRNPLSVLMEARVEAERMARQTDAPADGAAAEGSRKGPYRLDR